MADGLVVVRFVIPSNANASRTKERIGSSPNQGLRSMVQEREVNTILLQKIPVMSERMTRSKQTPSRPTADQPSSPSVHLAVSSPSTQTNAPSPPPSQTPSPSAPSSSPAPLSQSSKTASQNHSFSAVPGRRAAHRARSRLMSKMRG